MKLLAPLLLSERRSIFLSAGGAIPSTAAPCDAPAAFAQATNKNAMYGLTFAVTPDEFCDWTLPMPDNWNLGAVTAKFYWTAPAGALSGTVIWEMAGAAYGDDDTLDVALGTAGSATDTIIALNDLHISNLTGDIVVGGTPAIGDLV
ncbi:MAG: hypothetical protein WCK39_00085, partial [Methanomassiliicoccales archaeon]